MAVTEGRRRQLFEAARRALGDEEAETLMELVPAGFEPATRSDLIELRTELKGDIAELRAELKGDIAEVRREMAELRTELKGDIARVQQSFTTTLLVVTVAHIGITAALVTSLGR